MMAVARVRLGYRLVCDAITPHPSPSLSSRPKSFVGPLVNTTLTTLLNPIWALLVYPLQSKTPTLAL